MRKSSAGRPQKQESIKTGPGYRLANYLNQNLNNLTDLTNEELASALGYGKSNIISMFRTGKTKVPLTKITILSEVLNVNMLELLVLWFDQQVDTDGYDKIHEALGRLVTKEEAEIIHKMREYSGLKEYRLLKGAEQHFSKILITSSDDTSNGNCTEIIEPEISEEEKLRRKEERDKHYKDDDMAGIF